MGSMKWLFIILCFGTLLCGCQETPEEVKTHMGEYGDNPQITPTEITYCPASELKEARLPTGGMGNLELPEDIDFSGVESVELLHMSTVTDFLSPENIERYASLFGVETDTLEEEEYPSNGKSLTYDNAKERMYLTMSENGFLSCMWGQSYEYAPNKVAGRYNIDKDDLSGVSVGFADGKEMLADVCSGAERWMEDNMPIEGIRYRVSDACIRKPVEDGAEWVSMCAEYEYKGIRFNNHTPSVPVGGDGALSGSMVGFLSVEMECSGLGTPSYLSTGSGQFQINQTEVLEKVVDFESAVKILNGTISGFGRLRIADVLILYALFPDYGDKPAGRSLEGRPVYAFLVEKEWDDQGIGILKPNKCQNFFFVDMETGELMTDLDMGGGG